MKMNIFFIQSSLYRETAEKAIILNYDVINDVMMMQWNFLGASDKGKNDVTFGFPADPKLSENGCY